MLSIGDIGIYRRKVGNPYVASNKTWMGEDDSSLMGDERYNAIQALKAGNLPDTYDVWYQPGGGPARRVTAQEIFG